MKSPRVQVTAKHTRTANKGSTDATATSPAPSGITFFNNRICGSKVASSSVCYYGASFGFGTSTACDVAAQVGSAGNHT